MDFDLERINAWNTDHLPIYEPGLLEVLKPARDGIPGLRRPNLFFSTDIKGAIKKADLIFLCVPTPTKATGTGAGRAADMVYVEAAARMIAGLAESDKIVVEKSTVPCRTAENIRKTFDAIARPGLHFEILSNPEFLAEGTAINDLLKPDRVLIGSLKTTRGMQAAADLAQMYNRWIPHYRLITMNLWSSEMAKLSANALLAQRISSINALSAVCEATGADIEEVSYACGLDNRIGSRMLKSSVGFGGSCFKKDVLALVYIAQTHNLPEVAAYWKGVIDINEYQKARFIKRIVKCLFNTLTGKKVAILGYAYKKDTGDTRESAAIGIVNHLIKENAEVNIYDPKVEKEQIWQSLKESNDERTFDHVISRVSVCQTPYEACQGTDAVVIATEWDEFSNKTEPIESPRTTLQVPRARSTDFGPAIPSRDSSSRSSFVDTGFHSSTSDITTETPLSNMSRDSSLSGGVLQGWSLTDTLGLGGPAARKGSDDKAADLGYPDLAGDQHLEREKKKVDWSRVAGIMRKPMYVFDGRNVVDPEKLKKLGFFVEGIGKPGV